MEDRLKTRGYNFSKVGTILSQGKQKNIILSFENKYLSVVFACYTGTTEQQAQVASLSFSEKKKICEDQVSEYKWSQVGQNQIVKLKSKV